MANKKKRDHRKHQGMKKPSKKPKVLSEKEQSKILRKTGFNPPNVGPTNIGHKPADSQHLRRGNR